MRPAAEPAMMMLSTKLAAGVAELLMWLAYDHNGEIAATASAISRT